MEIEIPDPNPEQNKGEGGLEKHLVVAYIPKHTRWTSRRINRVAIGWQKLANLSAPTPSDRAGEVCSFEHKFKLAGFDMLARDINRRSERFSVRQLQRMHVLHFRDWWLKLGQISYLWRYEPRDTLNMSSVKVSIAADFESTAVDLTTELGLGMNLRLQDVLTTYKLGSIMDLSKPVDFFYNNWTRVFRLRYYCGTEARETHQIKIRSSLLRVPSTERTDVFFCLLNSSQFGRSISEYVLKDCGIQSSILLSEFFAGLENSFQVDAEAHFQQLADPWISLPEALFTLGMLLEQKLQWWQLLANYVWKPLEVLARSEVEAEEELRRFATKPAKNTAHEAKIKLCSALRLELEYSERLVSVQQKLAAEFYAVRGVDCPPPPQDYNLADSKSLLFAQVKDLICRPPGDQRRLLDTLTVQCEEPYLMPYLKFVQTEIDKCRWVQEKVPRDLHVSDRQHLCQIHEIFRSNFKRASIDEQQPQSLDRLYCIRSLTSFAPDRYLTECSAHFETRFAVFYDQTLFLVRIQATKNIPSVWMVNQASCLVHVATSNTTLRLPHFPFVYKDGFLYEPGAESNKSLFWDLTTYQATQKVGIWTGTNPDELMPCPGYPLQVNLVASMGNQTAYYLIATSISRMVLLSVQFSPETKALKIFR